MSMTRSDRDEGFQISEVSRRGAHRPRSNPLLSLLPLAGLAVLVVGVVGLAYALFGRGGEATGTDDPVTAASVVATPTEVAQSPTADASAGASGQASPSAGASQDASAAASPSASATVDRTTVLNFYNGSSPNIPGLSRKAANELKASGWTIGEILPWSGPAVSRTTVYYGTPDQLPTVRAVVKELGLGVAKVNTRYAPTGLTVVISNDWTP